MSKRMSPYGRRNACANLGKALERLGWELLGWHKDESDPMTDYYSPASWDGIATKADAVAVVDISADQVARKYGPKPGEEVYRTRPVEGGVECPDCNGSGLCLALADWTLERARSEPREYHKAEIRAQYPGAIISDRTGPAGVLDIDARRPDGSSLPVPMLTDVVSPIPFQRFPGFDDNPGERRRCFTCNGSARKRQQPERYLAFTYPQFQGNPPRKLWHVERDGRVLLSGVGLSALDEYGNKAREAADDLAAKIDRAAFPPEPDPDAAPHDVTELPGARLEVCDERGRLDLFFDDKPGTDARAALKAAGWRCRRRGGVWVWFHKDTPENREALGRLLGQAVTS